MYKVKQGVCIYDKQVKMKILVTLIGLVAGLPVLAQREANVWHFGKYAGVDFSSGFPGAFLTAPCWHARVAAV